MSSMFEKVGVFFGEKYGQSARKKNFCQQRFAGTKGKNKKFLCNFLKL